MGVCSHLSRRRRRRGECARVTELTINGDRAEVRVLQDGLTAATGVTLVDNSALVLVERTKGVVVPYRAR